MGSFCVNISGNTEPDMQQSKNDLKNLDIYVNLMCFIRDTAYKDRYVFNQPIIISQEKNETEKKSLKTSNMTKQLPNSATDVPIVNSSLHSETTLALLIMMMVLGVVGSMFLIVHYHRRKAKNELAGMTWEMNRLYHSEESIIEENNNEEEIIPDWLKSKPDMIYPARCIEQGQLLGRGQYGLVYKGKLSQGNAV